MKKISAEELKAFDKDIVAILSSERLEGYGGDIGKHFDNLELIKNSVKRIAILEIYLRNKLDFCLNILEGRDWIKNARSLNIIKEKGGTSLDDLAPHQILSSLMLGELVKLIDEYKVKHYMFNLEGMDFREYHWSNRNFFHINKKKNKFSNVEKVNIALNLIRTIRNRAFHWENLFKTRCFNGEIYPRITHKEKDTNIGIMPEKILLFLDDLLDSIQNDLIKKIEK